MQLARHVSKVLREYTQTYSYEQLKQKETLPASVDKTKLEEYLSDEEFASVFGMSRADWLKVPAWKRGPIKKDKGLF